MIKKLLAYIKQRREIREKLDNLTDPTLIRRIEKGEAGLSYLEMGVILGMSFAEIQKITNKLAKDLVDGMKQGIKEASKKTDE